jgi:hypothetical protein
MRSGIVHMEDKSFLLWYSTQRLQNFKKFDNSNISEKSFLEWHFSEKSLDNEWFATLQNILSMFFSLSIFSRLFWYRLVDKYMRQPPALSSGFRISRELISRV